MKAIFVKAISLSRFDALAAPSRSPAAAYVSRELAWLADDDENVLGVLLLDTIDHDFAGVVLGRDEGGRFRCIDEEASIPTEAEARAWLERAIKWHARDAARVFPQGDRTQGLDLFTPIVPVEKLHPGFVKFPWRSLLLNVSARGSLPRLRSGTANKK